MKRVKSADGTINDVDLDEIIAALSSLEENAVYLTKPLYRGDALKWPNNEIPFVDFHLNYLKSQPTLNPHHYISNLKLILKKKNR